MKIETDGMGVWRRDGRARVLVEQSAEWEAWRQVAPPGPDPREVLADAISASGTLEHLRGVLEDWFRPVQEGGVNWR